MINKKTIKLFWCSSKDHKNFGDELSPYIISKLSGRKVTRVFPTTNQSISLISAIISMMHSLRNHDAIEVVTSFINRRRKHILGLGSIINRTNSNSIVWGSGIIVKEDIIKNADFRAIRGPLTQARLKLLGFNAPESMGDPGLLISRIFKPCVKPLYKVGIIPHYTDYEFISSIIDNKEIKVIDLKTDNVEEVIEQINSCSLIISSSLHGLITSHSYGIPALWFRFGSSIGGDNIKFYDYYHSTEIFNAVNFSFTTCCINNIDDIVSLYEKNKEISLPKREVIDLRCDQLLQSAPFPINFNKI